MQVNGENEKMQKCKKKKKEENTNKEKNCQLITTLVFPLNIK